jgi:hypothetical protein
VDIVAVNTEDFDKFEAFRMIYDIDKSQYQKWGWKILTSIEHGERETLWFHPRVLPTAKNTMVKNGYRLFKKG